MSVQFRQIIADDAPPTFPIDTLAGSYLAFVVAYSGTPAATISVDDPAFTFVNQNQISGASGLTARYYNIANAAIRAAGTGPAITFSTTPNAVYFLLELTGTPTASVVDVSAFTSQGTSTSLTSGNLTTAVNDLVYGFLFNRGTDPQTPSGSSIPAPNTTGGNPIAAVDANHITGGLYVINGGSARAGTYGLAATTPGSNTWVGIGVAVKDALGAKLPMGGVEVDVFARPSIQSLVTTGLSTQAWLPDERVWRWPSELSGETTKPPLVTIQGATSVTSTSAIGNALVDPQGLPTSVVFDYGAGLDTAGNPVFGATTDPITLDAGFGFQSVSSLLAGLTDGQTYYVECVATNSNGLATSEIVNFDTPVGVAPSGPPIITAPATTSITQTSAILNATVDPNGAASTWLFKYRQQGATTWLTTPGGALAEDATATAISGLAPGLTAGTVYEWVAHAANANAPEPTGDESPLQTFTTVAPTIQPIPTLTPPAQSITTSGATLTGQVANVTSSSDVMARFDWGLTTAYGNSTPPQELGTTLPSTTKPISAAITGLAPATTYHYRLTAWRLDSGGTPSFSSADGSFTTATAGVVNFPLPTITPATSVSSSGATLNGSIDAGSTDRIGIAGTVQTSLVSYAPPQGYLKGNNNTNTNSAVATAAALVGALFKGGHAVHMTESDFSIGSNNPSSAVTDIASVGMATQQLADARLELARDAYGNPRGSVSTAWTPGALQTRPLPGTVTDWSATRWNSGATYLRTLWVAPGVANGAGNGTLGNPYSIVDAKNNYTAGDDIVLMDGDYTHSSVGGTLSFAVSGTATHPVRVRAQNPGGARIYWNDPTTHNSLIQVAAAGGDYMIFEDLELDGMSNCNLGFDVQNATTGLRNHVAIRRCYVHHCRSNGIAFRIGDYFRIDGNFVYECGNGNTTSDPSGVSINIGTVAYVSDGYTGFHHYIVNNWISGSVDTFAGTRTDGNGIILDNGNAAGTLNFPATLVTNNVVFHNGDRGIHVYRVSGGIFVVNNTCWENGLDTTAVQPAAGTAGEINSSSSVVTIANNITKAWEGTGGKGSLPYHDEAPGNGTITLFTNYYQIVTRTPNIVSAQLISLANAHFRNAPLMSTSTTNGWLSAEDPRTMRTTKAFELIQGVVKTDYTTWGGTTNRAWFADSTATLRGVKTALDLGRAQGAGTDITLVAFGTETWKNAIATNVIPSPAHMQDHANAVVDFLLAAAAQNGGVKYITHVSTWQEYKGRQNLGDPNATGLAPPTGWAKVGLPSTTSSGGTGTFGTYAWETDPATYNPDFWVPNAPNTTVTLGPANETNYRQYYAWAVTRWYNVLYDTLKAHPDPIVNTVQVGGPHYAGGGTTNLSNHQFPLGNESGTIAPYDIDYGLFLYWLKYSHGFDFISIDYSIVDFSDSTNANTAYVAAQYPNMGVLIRRIKNYRDTYNVLNPAGKRGVPIDLIEFYWDVGLNRTDTNYDESQQAFLEGLVLQQLYSNFIRKACKWQPMGDSNFTTVLQNKNSYFRNTDTTISANSSSGLVTNTGPGTKYLAYDTAKLFSDNFPVGTKLYNTTTPPTGMVWMASDTKLLAINTTSSPITFTFDGTSHTTAAQSVVVYSAPLTTGSFSARWQFQYGTTTAYGSVTPLTTLALPPIPGSVSSPISGLAPGTTYHYRLSATRSDGVGGTFVSTDGTFTTGTAGASVWPTAAISDPNVYRDSLMMGTGGYDYSTITRVVDLGAADGGFNNGSANAPDTGAIYRRFQLGTTDTQPSWLVGLQSDSWYETPGDLVLKGGLKLVGSGTSPSQVLKLQLKGNLVIRAYDVGLYPATKSTNMKQPYCGLLLDNVWLDTNGFFVIFDTPGSIGGNQSANKMLKIKTPTSGTFRITLTTPFVGSNGAATGGTNGNTGAWKSTTNYAINDIAKDGASSYLAIAASGPTSGGAAQPSVSPAKWTIIDSTHVPSWAVSATATSVTVQSALITVDAATPQNTANNIAAGIEAMQNIGSGGTSGVLVHNDGTGGSGTFTVLLNNDTGKVYRMITAATQTPAVAGSPNISLDLFYTGGFGLQMTNNTRGVNRAAYNAAVASGGSVTSPGVARPIFKHGRMLDHLCDFGRSSNLTDVEVFAHWTADAHPDRAVAQTHGDGWQPLSHNNTLSDGDSTKHKWAGEYMWVRSGDGNSNIFGEGSSGYDVVYFLFRRLMLMGAKNATGNKAFATNGAVNIGMHDSFVYDVAVVDSKAFDNGAGDQAHPASTPYLNSSNRHTTNYTLIDPTRYPATSVNENRTAVGATNANPILITTSTNHGLASGRTVTITGFTGNTAANVSAHAITVVSPTTFTLDGVAGNGNIPATGAGSTGTVTFTTSIVNPANSPATLASLLASLVSLADTTYG